MSEETPTDSATTPPLSASDKARLRRERREAKILAGGTDRLNKITNTAHNTSTPYKEHVVPQSMYDDPPDLAPDLAIPSTTLSGGGLEPRSSSSALPENPILKLLAAGRQQVVGVEGSGSGAQSSDAGFEEFVKQTVLSNSTGDGSDFDFFSAMMNMSRSSDGSQTPGSPGATSPAGPNSTSTMSSNSANSMSDNNRYWKSAHAVSIILLALFAVFRLGLKGSQMSRLESLGEGNGVVFWYFATIELLLQSGRFLIEKGRSPSKSIFTKVAQYIPAPYSSYLLLAARYTHIVANIITDFCLFVFLVGMNAWWNGI
ncbi:uncharacterized protein V1513DRAFT_461877 [Lipomyces chichibuensis]|uniref:uncharacterized protein n=1 Tax=Lipomyces chichibuensis TaxID=1546026 RepID=UPI0033433E0E